MVGAWQKVPCLLATAVWLRGKLTPVSRFQGERRWAVVGLAGGSGLAAGRLPRGVGFRGRRTADQQLSSCSAHVANPRWESADQSSEAPGVLARLAQSPGRRSCALTVGLSVALVGTGLLEAQQSCRLWVGRLARQTDTEAGGLRLW